MGFRRAKRRGSASWWGVCLCALLLVGMYVAFDVLDVDGSRIRRAPATDMMVAATSEMDAERHFRATLAIASSTDLFPPILPRLSAAEQYPISPAGIPLHVQYIHARSRVDVAVERARGNSPTTDPL